MKNEKKEKSRRGGMLEMVVHLVTHLQQYLNHIVQVRLGMCMVFTYLSYGFKFELVVRWKSLIGVRVG